MVESFFPGRIFKAFLFDFDGTVVDTMPTHLRAWNQALEIYGLTLSADQHQEWAGRPTRDIVQLLSSAHGIRIPVEDFLQAKEKHYLKALGEVQTISPVLSIIKASHGKIPMAIVSGSRRRQIETTLSQLSLTAYFDLIVAAEDYTQGKPAPDCFLQAAQRLNVSPADCLVFEDGQLGLEAAHAAQMPCLRVVPRNDVGHELILSPCGLTLKS